MRKRSLTIYVSLSFLLVLSCPFALTTGVNENWSSPSSHSNWDFVETGGWLSGWSYRKAHNVSGSLVGVQVNYPVMINVHYDNGFDYEGDIYLNGNCRTDFGDIRFTDFAGANLDYYIHQKFESTQALFWVEINYIPQSPGYTTIYVYYGNPNATTTSNGGWTFSLASDFEDGTTQGWSISWGSWVVYDGVSTSAFQGNYSRYGARMYGANAAGNFHFYESFQTNKYLASGTYLMEGAARFGRQDSYVIPNEIGFLVGGVLVDSIVSPGTEWHWLNGNFTIGVGGFIDFNIKFHLYVTNALSYGDEGYYIDSVLLRKWCDPEPTHGAWSAEQVSDDSTPPEINEIIWTPSKPYPLVSSETPRQGEPVIVEANVSDEGTGVESVLVSYRVDDGEWWNRLMTYNGTAGLWVAVIPGQLGDSTVEFFLMAYDNAENAESSSSYYYNVLALIPGDINGDGFVNIKDAIVLGVHFGESW